MSQLSAVVLGATGLIGGHLVEQLLQDPAFSKITILVRHDVDLMHPKLEVKKIDFSDLTAYRANLGLGDCIFCCVGTTNKKVKGDKEAYRKVDFDIPVNAAKMGRDAGYSKYLLVSAVGANARSSNFYLGLKGKVEDAIAGQHFESFHSFRPGILYGSRNESRVGESIGKFFMKGLSLLMMGPLAKYRGIEAAQVAKAMVQRKEHPQGNVYASLR